MIELCNYIYNNYPNLREKGPRWKLLSLLDRNEDKVVYIKEENKFKGAAMFARLTDDTFENLKLFSEYATISEKEAILGNPVVIEDLLLEKGRNIHFLYVLADGTKTLLRGLKKIIENEHPKTISWFKPDLSKMRIIYTKEIICLQSQSQ